MYKVSQNYIEALSEKVYDDRISGIIAFKDGGAINVNDDNLVKNSLKITRELCGKEYKIGSFNLGCLKMAVFDESALGRDYSGAVITLSYHLKLKNGGEETVPLGIFIADGVETSRKRDKVYITAYDGGIYFDREPSGTIRNMTATPIELITAICEECGTELGEIAENLPNSEVSVSIADKQIQTCRDAVMWCSALMCGYAVIDREGKLSIISAKYSVEENGTTITKARSIGVNERSSIYCTDTRAYIRYLTAYCGDEVRQYDSEYEAADKQASPASYAMVRNPLLSGKSVNECDGINRAWHEYIDHFMQRGITARIFGDPAIDVGDAIGFHGGDIDQRGSVIGVVTSYEWKYRNYHDIYCSAAECGERASSECITPSTKVRNQTEKRIDALSPGNNPSPTTAIGQVSFEKNRLYYNGETYHLQFGANKRIMCVTKGDKYALINSYGYTESRIEAATAVMNGLTEDWDLEFDCDDPEINVQSLLNGNYSGGDERKYENGRVKIKLTGTIPDVAGINFNWFECKREKGNLIHIGGRLSKVDVLCNRYKAEHITFGENIKVIGGVFFDKPSTIENGHEHGIPPFIEYISGFIYSGSGYLYIPESCKNIARHTFAYNSASEIEIEEKGGLLTVDEGAFSKGSNENGLLTVDVVKIPLRVSALHPGIFTSLGAKAIVFGKGITNLSYYNMDYINSKYFPLIQDIPCYIFIPASVTSIGSNLIYSDLICRKTFIIYEGSQSSWDNITKASNWGGGNSNVTVICDSSAYNNSESFINRFVRKN